MELFIKEQLLRLRHNHDYDPESQLDRNCMKYIFIPILQRECDVFAKMWNSHRIGAQKGLGLPTGVPNHMFECPESFGCEKKIINLSDELLLEVAELAEIDQAPNDFLSFEDRQLFTENFREPEKVLCKDLASAFILLKRKVHGIRS